MTVHEDALAISPFQAIAGRIRELVRGKNRRGSVGIGVGETMIDAEEHSDDVIRIHDIDTPSLRAKLLRIQTRKCAEFESYNDRLSDLPREVRELVQSEYADLESDDTVEWAIERFAQFAKRVRIVDTDYVASRILGIPGTVVFEGSQGVLLDKMHGFHPFTTQVRTTPASARSVMRQCAYDGEVQSLGVLRAYHTRHGRGPFVTENTDLTAALPDMTNKDHRWQGSFRVGHFDQVAAQYALQACGEGEIDGVVLTCVDRLWSKDTWEISQEYTTECRDPDLESLFDCFENEARDHEVIYGIKANPNGDGPAHLVRQEKIAKVLATCKPLLTNIRMVGGDLRKEWVDATAEFVSSTLKTRVVAVSVGQTEEDKIEIK
jgi:adenylosuccinate synthase